MPVRDVGNLRQLPARNLSAPFEAGKEPGKRIRWLWQVKTKKTAICSWTHLAAF